MPERLDWLAKHGVMIKLFMSIDAFRTLRREQIEELIKQATDAKYERRDDNLQGS